MWKIKKKNIATEWISCLIDRIAALHLLYMVVHSINIYSFMLCLIKEKHLLWAGAPSKTNYCEIFTDIFILYSTKQSSFETKSLQPDIIKDTCSVSINTYTECTQIQNYKWTSKQQKVEFMKYALKHHDLHQWVFSFRSQK